MLRHCMSTDNRQSPRFRDFARARVDELCQLPGFLEDVSKTGCKVRFSHEFEVDSEREYTLTIQPASRSGIREFDLTVRPEWVRKDDDAVEIGFSILHSPGVRQFHRYVELLEGLEDRELQQA